MSFYRGRDNGSGNVPHNSGGFGGSREYVPPGSESQNRGFNREDYQRSTVDWNSEPSSRGNHKSHSGYERRDYDTSREPRAQMNSDRGFGHGQRFASDNDRGYNHRENRREDERYHREDRNGGGSERFGAPRNTEYRGDYRNKESYYNDRRDSGNRGFSHSGESGNGGYRDNGYRQQSYEGRGGRFADNNRYNSSGNYGYRENRGNTQDYGRRNDGESFGNQSERVPQGWKPEVERADDVQDQMKKDVEDIDFGQDKPVKIFNSNVHDKVENWETSGLNSTILKNLSKCGYKTVRPIQAAIIPQILAGYDVMGQAETGGGKTAAFSLPIIAELMKMREELEEDLSYPAPLAIILAPSRELVKQTVETISAYTKGTGIIVKFAYGQFSRRENYADLCSGCHILVGACGRVMDFVQNKQISFHRLRFFVLDEADKMLQDRNNHGDHLTVILNEPDFKKAKKQVLLFSATFTNDVEDWMNRAAKNRPPSNKVVRAIVESGRLNPRINLEFVETNGMREKMEKLEQYVALGKKPNGSMALTLIFVQEKKRSDMFAINLSKKGFRCKSLNGDRSQDQRELAMKMFRDGDIDVLVGTDVCSRGLDIKNLERVINFDVPNDMGNVKAAQDTFIHRSGRTGRVKSGVSITFVDPRESRDLQLCPFFVECFEDIGKPDECPSFLRKLAGKGPVTNSSNVRAPRWTKELSDGDDDENEVDGKQSSSNFGKSTFGKTIDEVEVQKNHTRKDVDSDDSEGNW